MGGFAGGDEAGFWDDDTLFKVTDRDKERSSSKIQSSITFKDSVHSLNAHAAITPFIKFTGEKDGNLTLIARIMYVGELYDTISFVPCACDRFTIEGCDEIGYEKNSIYKAYQALLAYTNDSDIEEFFSEHKVHVKKRIPSSAGLCAAASDAAAFIRLAKEACSLVLSFDELISIGAGLNPLTAFFIHNTPSANISGFGEVVEPFEEEALKVEISTVERKCDPLLILKTFKTHLMREKDLSSFSNWQKRETRSLMKSISEPAVLNDLYAASLLACPDTIRKDDKEWYASSYGNAMFRVLN